jgi:hypothetical protein
MRSWILANKLEIACKIVVNMNLLNMESACDQTYDGWSGRWPQILIRSLDRYLRISFN